MPSCLGMYIEDNLIKYAKVSKNNDITKVESFGVKFYEDINSTIKQIIEETYSFKVPISINITDEIYNQIEVFSLLSKKDIDNVIKTEFEHICYEKEINKNLYEQKYLLTNPNANNEKIRAIHISAPKTSIEQRKNQFGEYRVSNMFPLSLSIANLIKNDIRENILIINLEKKTTITKVAKGIVESIEVIENGAGEILDRIDKKENSYSKAYEICKSSTIYTESDKDLQYEENEYLEDIMPTLYKIVSRIKNIVDNTLNKINGIYITGTGAIINNIDIYFQDYLKDIPCQILKPSFVSNNSKINIKDYIEVNSAIALAITALEKENANINFIKDSGSKKILSILNTNLSELKSPELPNSIKSISEITDKFSKIYNTICTTTLMLLIVYVVGSQIINNQFNKKTSEVENAISVTNSRISQIQEYNQKFAALTTNYEELINNIENMKDLSAQDRRYRNTIPNLLNRIMFIIPKEVQLTSIKNTTDTHIIITAKTKQYIQLAHFKTKLKEEEILGNIVSDTGVANGEEVTVTIEGELP